MKKKLHDSTDWSESLTDLLDELCGRVSYMTDVNINWACHKDSEISSNAVIVFYEEEKETKQIDLF